MDIEYDSLQVRPPWSDELPRLATFFPKEPLHSCHLFVLVAPEPERLVGAVALRMHADTAQLRCRLRPRVLHEKRGDPLITAALAAARAQGVRRIIARPSANAPEEHFLREHGFLGSSTLETWQINLEQLKSRLDQIPSSVEKRGTWTVRPPTATDEAQLIALFKSLRPERLRLRGQDDSPEMGFTPEISAVVVAGDKVIGALLLRGNNSLQCRIDLCAVAPGFWSAPVASALLRLGVQQALNEGYTSATFPTNDSRNAQGVRNLARRSGGTIQTRAALLTRELSENI